MFTPSAVPYVKPLSPGFVLKSVTTREDVERIGAFNAIIHSPSEDTIARSLILHHPHARPEHWLYVEEEATGQMISSLCLIPWRWRYDGIELRSGEMGFCGTLDAFRNRGFVRALMARHQELLAEGGYHLSHIQGIPYFYRQFGYEYALPLIGGWEIELRRIEDGVPPEYRFRTATVADIPSLTRLYDETVLDLDIHADRDADEWRYLLLRTPQTGALAEIWIVEDLAGQIVGYWHIEHGGFSPGLNISEASRMDHLLGNAVLRQLKALAVEKGKPFIRLWMAESNTLIRTAAGLGAENRGRYEWQMNIPNVPHLLTAIAPALERRIAASMYAGLSEAVLVNLYKQTFSMRFEGGRLISVDSLGFTDEGAIRIPPLLFAPLVLGWKTRTELEAIYPDFSVWGAMRPLVDVLFPKMNSHIYTIY